MSRIPRRPSPAMVVAFISLCVALAGTATALPGRNQVKKDDIARSAVRARHIRSNNVENRHLKQRSVTRSKIGRNSVNSDLVATDALTGTDVLEASFGKVPDADKLDGNDATAFESTDTVRSLSSGQVRMSVTDADRTVLTVGPFSLVARCRLDVGTIRAELLVTSAESHSAVDTDVGEGVSADFGPGDERVVGRLEGPLASRALASGRADALSPSGTAVTVRFTIGRNLFSADVAAAPDCTFAGVAIVQA
jgi:hypothetical protein